MLLPIEVPCVDAVVVDDDVVVVVVGLISQYWLTGRCTPPTNCCCRTYEHYSLSIPLSSVVSVIFFFFFFFLHRFFEFLNVFYASLLFSRVFTERYTCMFCVMHFLKQCVPYLKAHVESYVVYAVLRYPCSDFLR